MLDTGNFVLIASGNHSDYAWQSFKSPTNTILPTQILDLGSVLVSRFTETNFSKGRFELHFSDGSLQLIPVAWPTPSQYKNHYFRATLDFDGVFTEYAYPKNSAPNQSWFTIQRLPNNICTATSDEFGSGACGFNSYCLLQNGRRFCEFPPEYLFVDPTNRFSGCKPNYWQGCRPDDGSRNAEELYEIKELADVNWPLGDYEMLELYNQTECETSCLHDCLCVVAVKP
ncbi:hypothetical protein CICLE_v10023698mg [Citrus x clementina]|uniref:Bulb-type lectin domain-containing protein n=1 Tax=Citrus clementina TaxID=85681 RepID=V4TU99_CITCL|nr:G-type lectin S-receptor-like serine/threonine-protein kinase LECRK3 [Citrus sinensis]ESR53466.1 hypothetical protein CICLE_v10023698mg [Citrus x clementina]